MGTIKCCCCLCKVVMITIIFFIHGDTLGKFISAAPFFLFCGLCDFQFECKISTHPCRCQGTQGPQCPLISFEMPHSVPGANAD